MTASIWRSIVFLHGAILWAITAPVAILWPVYAVGSRARLLPVRLLSRGHISIVRGVLISFFSCLYHRT